MGKTDITEEKKDFENNENNDKKKALDSAPDELGREPKAFRFCGKSGEALPGRICIETGKKRLIAAAIVTLVLAIVVGASRRLYYAEGVTDSGVLLGLSAAGVVLCGAMTAFKLRLGERGAYVYRVVVFLLMPMLALFMSETMQGVNIYDFSPLSTFANYIVFMLIFLFGIVILGDSKLSMIVMLPVIFIASLAANLVLAFRGTPLMPADILSVGTALNVAGGYHPQVNCYHVMSVILLVLLELLVIGIQKKQKKRKHQSLVCRLLSLIIIAGVLIPFYFTDVAADHGLKPDFWDQVRGYHRSGTVLNFVLNTKYLIVEKPDDYNPVEIPSIVNDFISKNADDPGIFASAQMMQAEAAEKASEEALNDETGAQEGESENTTATSGAAKAAAAGTSGTTATDTSGTATATGAGNAAKAAAAGTSGTTATDTSSASGNATDAAVTAEPQKLPNTAADTPLAVTGKSSTSQPKTSAKLKKNHVPDIIVVMNESYSDLRVLGGFETNQDYMPFTRTLTKNTIKGNLYMPVNGAGTSNSEFEFLTGNSMAFLTGGSNAYELYVKTKLPSIAQTLGQLGYSRVGFHTYYGSSWKRNVNYPLLGFEDFISIEDLFGEQLMQDYRNGDISFTGYRQSVEAQYPDDEGILLRRFVSDSFDFKEVERMYDKRDEDKPYFMFNVTMQNHGGYDLAYANFEQKINIVSDDGTYYPKANRYLSLVYESDQAFKELVEYYSKSKDPVIILMFGDHQPSIEEEFIEKLLGEKVSDLTIEQKQKRFVTPFILWANYDITEGYIDKMSANYLQTLLLQVAGLDTTDYNDYLSALYRQIPVIDTTGYITADGVYHTYDESNDYTELLNDYEKVEYNNLFDNLFRHNELFYLDEDE